MDMVITTAPINRTKFKAALSAVWVYCWSCAFCSSAQAETTFNPKISADAFAYWITDKTISNESADGLALQLTPEIRSSISTPNIQTSLFWQDEAIWYKDSQRSQHSAQSYNVSNRFSAFNQRVSWGVTAASSYQITDSRQGIYSDLITGSENLAKTTSYGTYLDFNTLRGAATKAHLRVSYANVVVGTAESNTNTGYKNENYAVDLNMGSDSRSRALFWNISGNARHTDRQQFDDFDSQLVNMVVGIPLFSQLSLLGRGSYEMNDNGSNYSNEFSSYGVGLQLKLGRASWLNVTYNRSDLSNDFLEDTDLQPGVDEYIATELFLAPSRRTSLSFSLDKRYFGRTMDVAANYNMKFFTIRLSASDTVRSQSVVDQQFEDLGIFVCPNGSSDFNDCFRPPTSSYTPGAGESFQQVSQSNPELNERIILNRNAAIALGYSKNRLAVRLNIGVGEDEYVETNQLTRRNTLALSSSWKFSTKLKGVLEANYYQFDYVEQDREDKNMSLAIGLTNQLSKHVELTFNLRRTARESSVFELDMSENRIWFGGSYAF